MSYRAQVRRWLTGHLPMWDLVMCHQLSLHSVEANRVARAHGRCACHLLVAAQEYSDIVRLSAVRGGRSMLRRAVLEADALFVLSAQSRRELEGVGADPARIHDYRYFVDVDRFAPDGTPPAREFLCLGRWHAQKNLPLLLDAFDRIGAVCPDIHLRFVGSGPEEEVLRRRIAASPFAPRIHVEGWATDPVPLYTRAWALVTSSDAEGLSNVMIEAMACGTPVITTDVSGAREALDLTGPGAAGISPEHGVHGAGGTLVPMRNPQALAGAMRTMASDENLRADLSRSARRRAVERFCEEINVRAFLEVAIGLTNGRRAAAPVAG
jgi:glycosyltransferase involved in cell wall biosynthesis